MQAPKAQRKEIDRKIGTYFYGLLRKEDAINA